MTQERRAFMIEELRRTLREACGPGSFMDDGLALLDELATKEERTPSGEGWQQRIAAMDPWSDWTCIFCGCVQARWDSIEQKVVLNERPHAETCLWQHAKDTTPPASRGEGAKK